jgi:hypothetical protein
MRYPPLPRQKVCKVFEGETLGLDFQFAEQKYETMPGVWISPFVK